MVVECRRPNPIYIQLIGLIRETQRKGENPKKGARKNHCHKVQIFNKLI